MYRKYIKRILDIILSGVSMILLSPILLTVAILVRVKLGRPILFVQERLGKDEKVFRLYKFRSMTNKVDEDGMLLPDIKRLTKFGLFLRKTSLDELPELFNIFKGDMSFVGPRPLLVCYLPYYTERERLRHSVRSGLTGLAQVNGRNYLDWNRRLELDVEYVENMSFFLDLKIIIKTFFLVLERKGVAVDGNKVEGSFIDSRQTQTEEK